MSHLGMLIDDPPALRESAVTPIARSSRWVRARRSGLLSLEVERGSRVARGQLLGWIRSAFGDERVRVKSPEDGVVIGLSLNPLVRQGDAVIHVATDFE